MIKRELKVNLKSFIIWLSILIGMFLIVFLIYPYIITEDTAHDMDELMKVFPVEVLKAFNMDMSSIGTSYGWLKTEGFVFVLLIIGVYSSLLGGNILLKEESEKTIEYLGVLPIKRSRIVTNKIIASVIYIVAMVLLLGLFNYLALSISGEFNVKEFVLLSITPLLVALPLFAVNLFISAFMHKSKKVMGISLGLVFVFYLLNVIGELSDKVEFIKYFSLYTLADVRNVINSVTINYLCVIISILITTFFSLLTYFRYNKKELV